MNGFTLYETLRLLIPGGVAATILGSVLHILSFTGDHPAIETAANAVTGGATFFVLTLALGFILYALDFPSRTRLSRSGDPAQGINLPTSVLSEILKGTAAQSRAFSLYFLLSDAHMPAEAHRKVYFFGGIYRIFADARILLASALMVGVQTALALNSESPLWQRDFLPEAALQVALAAVLLLTVGAVGELGHAHHSVARQKRDAVKKSVSLSNARAWSDYFSRTARAMIRIGRAASVLFVVTTASILLQQADGFGTPLAWILAAVALSLWLMIEIGPPNESSDSKVDLRSAVLRALGLAPWDRSQYLPIQRALFDLALMVPLLIGSTGGRSSDVPVEMVGSSWFMLAFLCVLIMSVRKHEVRLLNTYKDQVHWLELNRAKIRRLGHSEDFGSGWI